MKSFFSTSRKLGILGGGQLGKMLLAETQKWDIYTCVLDPSEEAPSADICQEFVQGNFKDYETVYRFGKKMDVLTVEIEHINIEALIQLQKEGVKVFPQPEVLQTVQHKGLQKDFFATHNIPTANYQRFENKKEFQKIDFQYPIVWKSAQLGYDGMGVRILKKPSERTALPDVPCIIEEFVSIKEEYAVIVARNPNGEVTTYPVVAMEFHTDANQVEKVISPAQIPKEIAAQIQKIALQVSKAFQHIGLLAIEFLMNDAGAIFVNEVAPRPHNSGHYSIETSYTNQFEQHLRAILNLPLGKTANKLTGIMVNLVGAEGYTGKVIYKNIEKVLTWEGVTPHLYGKKETRPFRKMGHITVVHKDMKMAYAMAEKIKNTVKVISGFEN